MHCSYKKIFDTPTETKSTATLAVRKLGSQINNAVKTKISPAPLLNYSQKYYYRARARPDKAALSPRREARSRPARPVLRFHWLNLNRYYAHKSVRGIWTPAVQKKNNFPVPHPKRDYKQPPPTPHSRFPAVLCLTLR